MVEKVNQVWMDGKLVPWDQATVHVMTHTLHYGFAAFEGIRCYRRSDGSSAIFRLDDHLGRLYDSSHILGIEVPFAQDVIRQACVDVLKANKMPEGYLRPLVYIGEGAMGLYAIDNPVRVAVVAFKWGAYLGEEGLKNGIRAKISSFTRHHVNASMSKGKIVGHYVNSILAKREVKVAGYDEAIMLDTSGYVAEASGENLFIVRKGELKTPPYSASILGGITRDSILELAGDLGIPTRQARVTRDELYTSDEVFLTGTAAEVTPVREVDNRRIGRGDPGPITRKLQATFFETVRGPGERRREWLTFL